MPRRTPLNAGFRHVLCPVDFSADSRAALRHGAAIAQRSKGALTVLYVNDPLLLAAAAAGYDRQALTENTDRELSQFVRKAIAPRVLASVSLECEVAFGQPAREIMARAKSGRYELIVLGTRGLNGAKKLFFGSTTSAVLRHTRIPVLMVPLVGGGKLRTSIRPAWPAKRIVAAIELGAHAAADARRYAETARANGGRLTLVHVVPVAPPPPWYRGKLAAQIRARTSAAERTLVSLAERHADVVDDAIVCAGYPPDEITAVAAGRGATLVMMMLRARPGLVGAAAGTIAYHVLCHRAAPVLALPAAR